MESTPQQPQTQADPIFPHYVEDLSNIVVRMKPLGVGETDENKKNSD